MNRGDTVRCLTIHGLSRDTQLKKDFIYVVRNHDALLHIEGIEGGFFEYRFELVTYAEKNHEMNGAEEYEEIMAAQDMLND
jgi:hypothetical protein